MKNEHKKKKKDSDQIDILVLTHFTGNRQHILIIFYFTNYIAAHWEVLNETIFLVFVVSSSNVFRMLKRHSKSYWKNLYKPLDFWLAQMRNLTFAPLASKQHQPYTSQRIYSEPKWAEKKNDKEQTNFNFARNGGKK